MLMLRKKSSSESVMSEAAEEESGCSGTYEPEEGSSISQDDSDICRDLMERLRELEAENSALALANENQREAYERCLDEVANHVVQALLNQKDLREECIKLKKRVFDLEWQNRALSDLYQQKMQVTTGSLPQLKLQPVGEQNPNAPQGGVEASATSHALSFTAGHGQHNVDLISKEDMTSDESLADSVTSQPFAACGSLTRTLDSGIGTFPLPDYSNNTAGKNIPKLKSKLEQPPVASSGKMSVTTKVPRKARTLEREVPNAEEPFVQAKDLSTPLLNAALQSSEAIFDHHAEKLCREDSYGDHIKQRRSQENKNWTFPNSKASGNTPDNFLCIPGDLQQLPDTSENVRPSTGDGKGHSAVASLSLQPSLSFTRRVSSRASSSKDLGQESVTEVNGSEVVQGMVSPQRHTPLETSESLSDSLYDSLSSCGSQG